MRKDKQNYSNARKEIQDKGQGGGAAFQLTLLPEAPQKQRAKNGDGKYPNKVPYGNILTFDPRSQPGF